MQLYRSLWHQAEQFKILTSFPLHLDIELSGICNLKCKNCFQNGLVTQPLGMMPFDLYQKIIDEGAEKGLCAAKLQVRGESFLHPRFIDCIHYAKEKGIIDVQVTTNATILDQVMIKKILQSGLDAIIFSVDHHHGENFERLHTRRQYKSIESAIRQFLKMRKEQSKRKPWVRIQSSIPTADQLSVETQRLYLEQHFPLADIIVVNRIYNYETDVDAFPDLQSNYQLHPCSYLMHRLTIFWNGAITICCADYNDTLHLGNFGEDTIEKIWLSDIMNGYRKIHQEYMRDTMPICCTCGACVSIKKDQTLRIDSTKRHKDDYCL